ncbi:hypothetical protein PJP10_31510, partial [Mycobacterium kansasii]
NLILHNRNYTLQNDLEESWKIVKLNCKFSQSGERLEKLLGMGKSRNNKYGFGYEKARTRTGYGKHEKSDTSSSNKGKNLTY